MIRKFTLLFGFMVFSFSLIAQNQTFGFLPGNHIAGEIKFEHYKNFQVDLVHEQTDNITFGWVTTACFMPDKWEYSSCDNGGCYGLLPDSAMVGPLADTVDGYIRLTINPRQQTGTGTATIYVYDTRFPDQGQYVTFEITAVDNLTAIADVRKADLRISPNPAKDFINIKNTAEKPVDFTLTDLSGKMITRTSLPSGANIAVPARSLPAGLYLGRFNTGQTTIIQKIIIH